MSIADTVPAELIRDQVQQAISEDLGEQDLTAALIPASAHATANVITRENAVFCGQQWFDEVYAQLDPEVTVNWQATDGQYIPANTEICQLSGAARHLLAGERTAMNFVQTLSATSTLANRYAKQVAGLNVKLLDTRKTLPGYRLAQKYAVRCGGCHNHRIGLYDSILIKENHINATGSIEAAIKRARELYPAIAIEIEVENITELQTALACQADIILLDNFDLNSMRQAVELNQGLAQLEASGGITLDNVHQIAQTGVDRISIGALTKDIKAIDLSMRFQ